MTVTDPADLAELLARAAAAFGVDERYAVAMARTALRIQQGRRRPAAGCEPEAAAAQRTAAGLAEPPRPAAAG